MQSLVVGDLKGVAPLMGDVQQAHLVRFTEGCSRKGGGSTIGDFKRTGPGPRGFGEGGCSTVGLFLEVTGGGVS